MLRKLGVRLAFSAVLILLPLELLSLQTLGAEPYPALFMPNFGGVPQRNGGVEVSVESVWAETPGGKTVLVDPVALMPNETALAESIAGAFFTQPSRVKATAENGWLSSRLSKLFPDDNFDKLTVELDTKFVDPVSRKVIRETVMRKYTVMLESDTQ